jgi:RTX calcium-binding nonapeptide repeat (4 copies)/Peptidase_C39 like family
MTRKARLSLEALEAKAVPSGNPGTGGSTLSNFGPPPVGISLSAFGTLSIVGTDRNETGHVWVADGQVHARLSHSESHTVQGVTTTVTFTDVDKTFDPAQVKHIDFFGRAGNDLFTNDTGIASSAWGGAGDDFLTGGTGNDLLAGNTGDDTLEGRAGNDSLAGGSGDDTYVFAPSPTGLGADLITEAANADTDTLDFSALAEGVTVRLGWTTPQAVIGPYLKLTLSSGLGIEDVLGGAGNDWVVGNDRANVLDGAAGGDTLSGGGGADVLYGGDGNDDLHGDAGADNLHGGAGNDVLDGGAGPNFLYGDDGNDTLFGGADNDWLDGGVGMDTLVGDAGNDKLFGGPGDDLLDGGAGDDTMDGGFGLDALLGRAGNDSLTGGTGNDLMSGGTGMDVLHGDAGDDSLDGGPGTDSMDGGAGTDSLFANRGDETLANGEHVEITVPGGSPQTDSWSCGPNSASRLLRSYGLSVSYDQLRAEVQLSNLVSDFGLGTPPQYLQQVMQLHKADVHLASGASFQDILARLGEGPVLALIDAGDPTTVPIFEPWFPIPVEFDTAPGALHYICLTGFDLASSTIFFTDTDGTAKSMGFAEFQQRWNFPADGAVYDGLYALGVKKQTMLW